MEDGRLLERRAVGSLAIVVVGGRVRPLLQTLVVFPFLSEHLRSARAKGMGALVVFVAGRCWPWFGRSVLDQGWTV